MIFVDETRRGIGIILHPEKESGKELQIAEATIFYYKLSFIPMVILYFIFTVAFPPHAAQAPPYFSSLGPIGNLVYYAIISDPPPAPVIYPPASPTILRNIVREPVRWRKRLPAS